MDRIRSLRAPNSNIQVIQQTKMLRYRALFHFMLEHHPQLANEIKQAYMNTMKWYYSHHFDRFKRALEKVRVENKVELLGDESKKSGLFASSSNRTTAAGGATLPVNDPFHLGDRIEILKGESDLVSMQAKDLDRPVHPIFTGTHNSILLKSYFEIIIRRLWITRRTNTFSSPISWEQINLMISPPYLHLSLNRHYQYLVLLRDIS